MARVELFTQSAHFVFQVVQVFLVTTLTSAASAATTQIIKNPLSAKDLLAKNLPKASNYFLAYLLLQALSVSAGSLLRTDRLLGKFVLGPMFDKSVTQMVMRRRGPGLQWGTFVPVFTNLSCIGTSKRQKH